VSRILIVTPAPPRSRTGNRVTATRWARLLRSVGHRVAIAEDFCGQKCDLLIALHARKSAPAIARFARQRPARPIVLALTGTDVYRDIHSSAAARRSLELADRLVILQPRARNELPRRLHAKTRVIYQSVEPPGRIPPLLKRVFEVCVSGHLRPVKDPFRAALAARRLPAESRVAITHIGAALTDSMAQRARAETERNARYRWLGEVPRGRARQIVARSRLLALSSKLEGGANVVGEAIVAGTPVVSSRIPGSIGLLGEDYAGYFEVGDTAGLAAMLRRAETDRDYYAQLTQQCKQRAELFAPMREQNAWRDLIAELLPRG